MIKSFVQAKNYLFIFKRKMNKDLKNLKISPEVHQKLLVESAKTGVKVGDLANILLALSMSASGEFKENKENLIKEFLQNGMSKS